MTAGGILGRIPLLAKWSGRMIQIKTPHELELMRGAGLVVAGAIAAVAIVARPRWARVTAPATAVVWLAAMTWLVLETLVVRTT